MLRLPGLSSRNSELVPPTFGGSWRSQSPRGGSIFAYLSTEPPQHHATQRTGNTLGDFQYPKTFERADPRMVHVLAPPEGGRINLAFSMFPSSQLGKYALSILPQKWTSTLYRGRGFFKFPMRSLRPNFAVRGVDSLQH